MTDALDRFGDSGNGIEGIWVTFNGKTGEWSFDGREIGETDVKMVPIMDSITVGKIRFDNGKVTARKVGRLSDGFYAPETAADLEHGYNPYVAFQGVFADGGYTGELGTFTSSSWGGLFAVQKLINPFRLKRRAVFPICRLGSKERGDVNGTIDPVFPITGWTARSNFAELLGPMETTQIAAPEAAPRIAASVAQPAPKSTLRYAAEFTPPAPPTADDGFAGVDPGDMIYD